MNKLWLWFLLSCKRQLKKTFFLVLLLLIPAGVSMFHQIEKEDSGRISIALFTDGDEWNRKVAETLVKGEHSFEFYLSDTLEALKNDVASGRAECGYHFPAGFREMLENGDYKRSVRLYASPSTVAHKLSSEVVFAGLFQVLGRELLKEYTVTGRPFEEARAQGMVDLEPESVWARLEPLYDQYLENGSTFAFEYETAGNGPIRKDSVTAVFPVRGIGAVFIFVMGLTAAVTAAEDEKRGFFLRFSAGRKRIYMMVQLAVPILLSCLCVCGCLLLSDSFRGAGPEWAALFVYGMMTLVFSGLLLFTIKNSLVIAGLIPFFILGSMIICPIFADLSAFVPIIGVLRHFFLPYYYLVM